MRPGWVIELQRVVAAQDATWSEETRLSDLLRQDGVLSGKLARLHQELAASEAGRTRRRRADMWSPAV